MEVSELFKRILVGVDSEGLASNAIVRAATLSRELGSKIDLVHGVDIPPAFWPGITEDDLAAMHASALAGSRKRTIENLQPALREAGWEDKVDDLLSVHPGHPAKVILRRAEELGSDLIFLGPHGKRNLFDFGSTARVVLSRSDCPVWTQIEPVTPIEKILVPVDFSDQSRHALEVAHALALRLGASLRVLHGHAPPTFAYVGAAEAIPGPTYVIDRERDEAKAELERWMTTFEWGSVSADSTFVEGEAAPCILEELDGIDLVVMGTHGRTGLSRFLIGSVAYTVLKQSKKPVLVIPSPKRTWLLEENQVQGQAIVQPALP